MWSASFSRQRRLEVDQSWMQFRKDFWSYFITARLRGLVGLKEQNPLLKAMITLSSNARPISTDYREVLAIWMVQVYNKLLIIINKKFLKDENLKFLTKRYRLRMAIGFGSNKLQAASSRSEFCFGRVDFHSLPPLVLARTSRTPIRKQLLGNFHKVQRRYLLELLDQTRTSAQQDRCRNSHLQQELPVWRSWEQRRWCFGNIQGLRATWGDSIELQLQNHLQEHPGKWLDSALWAWH